MPQQRPVSATEPVWSPQFLPIMLLLFVGSGCAALIYEVVWFQLLQLVIGSSAVSLGLLLSTFMGGMCLGSLLLPRFVGPRHHPLRVYAFLELGIGILGIAVLFGVPAVTSWYAATAGTGLSSIFTRSLLCAVFLLPVTMLMGATLPAIARYIEMTPAGISWLGFFYGGNIVGAVFGCLLAGFYLLRVHDMVFATAVAFAINIAVTLLALGLAAVARYKPTVPADAAQAAQGSPGSWAVYLAIALSGASALGAEVVWTRLLSLMLGPTTYTFSVILAVFLIGLGIGSSFGSFLAKGIARPRLALAICQVLLILAIAWSAHSLTRSLPYWPIDTMISTSLWFNFHLDILRSMWAVLPAALLWGASFPLALFSVAHRGQDPGRLVGRVYAANTVGAIFGAAFFSMLVVAWVGSQQAQQVLLLLPAVGAALLLAPMAGAALVPAASAQSGGARRGGTGLAAAGAALILVTAGVAAWAWTRLPETPWELVAFGRNLPTRDLVIGEDGIPRDRERESLFVGEGVSSSVAVTKSKSSNTRYFHVAGKVEASSEPADMRLQRMLGHLPGLIHPEAKSVLIVGCGAGVTAGSFAVYPNIERIVICDIEPLIPQFVAPKFAEENHHILEDKRLEIVYDDARHYLLTTREKFDIITSDPIHPWVKGAASLYTQEYFQLVKSRLNPGGVVSQWVPLYESTLDVVRSEVATFFAVFPNGTIWSNDIYGSGYDTVMLGHADDSPVRIDVDQLTEMWKDADHKPLVDSMARVGFESPLGLLSTYAGNAADLTGWLAGAEINRDRNLRLQYLAGFGLNLYQGGEIFNQIQSYCTYPDDLFKASDASRDELEAAILGGLRGN